MVEDLSELKVTFIVLGMLVVIVGVLCIIGRSIIWVT